MTLLITGGTGYLGGELVRQAGAAAAHPRLELLVLDSNRASTLLRTPLPGVRDRIGVTWKTGSGG